MNSDGFKAVFSVSNVASDAHIHAWKLSSGSRPTGQMNKKINRINIFIAIFYDHLTN